MARFFIILSFVCCMALYGQESTKDKASGPRQALDGNCPVSLVELRVVLKGEEKFQSTYRGLRYHFLSEEEKQVFDNNPEIYAVAFGGIDVVATYGEGKKQTQKVFGNGNHTVRHEGRTFQFENQENERLFRKTPDRYVSLAGVSLYKEAEKKRGKTLAEIYPSP